MRKLLLSLVGLLATSTAAAESYLYNGRFQNLSRSTHAECETLLDDGRYEAQVHLLPARPGVNVLNFAADSDEQAAFDGMSFTGRIGAGEVIYEKIIRPRADRRIEYYIEGLVDYNVLALDIGILVIDTTANKEVCRVEGEFFGSN